MLEFKNILKNFRKADNLIEVLNGVNLEVHPGEFVAVQGASGCGKTTFLLIAGGLLHPTEGKVFFDREDVYIKSSEERATFRAKKFGFVFQQYQPSFRRRN